MLKGQNLILNKFSRLDPGSSNDNPQISKGTGGAALESLYHTTHDKSWCWPWTNLHMKGQSCVRSFRRFDWRRLFRAPLRFPFSLTSLHDHLHFTIGVYDVIFTRNKVLRNNNSVITHYVFLQMMNHFHITQNLQVQFQVKLLGNSFLYSNYIWVMLCMTHHVWLYVRF